LYLQNLFFFQNLDQTLKILTIFLVETVTLGHVSIGRVNCVTSHPTQGGIILSGSSDCTARVWDCNTKSLVTKIKFEAGVTAASYLSINERDF